MPLQRTQRLSAASIQGSEERGATFETRLRAPDEVRAWVGGTHPVVVVEEGGAVVVFASSSAYRPRDCYSGIAEFSVYVDATHRVRGHMRAALLALIRAAEQRGFWKLISRIFVENVASRVLVRALSFREASIYEKHGRFDGQWREVVMVEMVQTASLEWLYGEQEL